MSEKYKDIYVYGTYVPDELGFMDSDRNFYDSKWVYKIAKDYHDEHKKGVGNH